jgi:hypothetical protein
MVGLAEVHPVLPKISSKVELPKASQPGKDGLTNGAEGVPVVVSRADKRELAKLAKEYVKVAKDNFPLIIRSLKLDAHPIAKPVVITVSYAYGGVAATTAEGSVAQMVVSAKYALAHPNDLGMIVHEMVHVVQSYPNDDPGWLVEGIADWVRWFKYEPVANRPHPSAAKADARGSYQTTAAFLDWATKKYDANLIPKLNAALQANTYKESLWQEYTGKTLDQLNDEWIASLKG